MWGYNLAARNLGIRHTVLKDLQVEPQGEGTDDMDTKIIYHYTFGLTPKPPARGGVKWRLDKRQYRYYGGYPSDHGPMPPKCTAKSGFVIASMWNEAAQGIPSWPNKKPALPAPDAADGVLGSLLASTTLEATAAEGEPPTLGELLRGTGPWSWGAAGQKLFFYSRGVAYAPLQEQTTAQLGGLGRWVVSGAAAVSLTLCGAQYELVFEEPSAPWGGGFVATRKGGGAEIRGSLPDKRQHVAAVRRDVVTDVVTDGGRLMSSARLTYDLGEVCS